MRLSTPVLVAAVIGLLSLPSASVAAPGSAAVDQYRENIPADAGGGDGSGSKGGGGSGTKLPRAGREALEDAGQDGKDLARALGASGTNTDAPASDADAGGAGSTPRPDSSSDAGAGGTGSGGSGTPDAAPAATDRSGSEDASTAGSAVEAGVSADLGPVPLWAALAVVLLASVGFAMFKRARS